MAYNFDLLQATEQKIVPSADTELFEGLVTLLKRLGGIYIDEATQNSLQLYQPDNGDMRIGFTKVDEDISVKVTLTLLPNGLLEITGLNDYYSPEYVRQELVDYLQQVHS